MRATRILACMSAVALWLLCSALLGARERTAPISEEWLLFGDEFMVTATKHVQRQSEAPGTVEVITAREIQEIGALTVGEALAYIPGIRILPEATGDVIELWGLINVFGEMILLLVDGRPANTPFYGGADIDFNHPVGLVKQIEFIKGPGSALYGANAYAGVVNIITYKGGELEGVHSLVRARTDKKDIFVETLIGGVQGKLDYSLSLSGRYNEARDMVNTDNPNRMNRNLNARMVLNWPGYRVEFVGLEADNPIHGSINLRTPASRKETKGFVIGFEREAQVDLNTELKVRVSVNRRSRVYDLWAVPKYALGSSPLGAGAAPVFFPHAALTPLCAVPVPDPTDPNCFVDETTLNNALQAVPGYTEDYERFVLLLSEFQAFGAGQLNRRYYMRETLYEGDIQWDRRFSDSHLLTLGVAGRIDHLATEELQRGTMTGANWAVYAQDLRRLTPRLNLTLGARYDKHDVYGSNLSPRISLLYDASDRFDYKLSYGSAFRAPNQFELYADLDYLTARIVGSADAPDYPRAVPEEIDTVEFNARFRQGNKYSADLNLFHIMTRKDMISHPENRNVFIQDDLGLLAPGAIFPTEALAGMPGSGFPPTLPVYIVYRSSQSGNRISGFELKFKGAATKRIDWWTTLWHRHKNAVNTNTNLAERWKSDINGLNLGLRWRLSRRWFLRIDSAFRGRTFQPAEKAQFGLSDKRFWQNGRDNVTDVNLGAEWNDWTLTVTGRNIFGNDYLRDYTGDPSVPASRVLVQSRLDPEFAATLRWKRDF